MSAIKCIIKCAQGHKLKYTSANSLFKSNQDYLGGFSCNHCNENYVNTGSYHCNTCCYDLCSVCYGNRADGNCPEGHKLKKYKTPEDDYGCDICEDTVSRGSALHGCRICNWDLCSKCFSPKTVKKQYEDKPIKQKSSKKSKSKLSKSKSNAPKSKSKSKQKLTTEAHSKNVNNQGGFSNFGALGELLQIIDNHMLFMNEQEANVDEFIDNSGSADLLHAAKDKALETEKELMQEIMNISEINTFLNNIILIENLFNSFYTTDIKQQQRAAREKYAAQLNKYETQSKPNCDIGSFVELMFAGTNLHISSFKKWLDKLVTACKENNVNIIEHSGAKGKNIERAFYKSFYVYAVTYGDDGFKQMTDVLRCSLVFENFDDLYHCFALIEELSAEDDNGGILRCKDRFNPSAMPFGYRDLLINIYCPGSKIVAEIQLHLKLFYKRKKISHTMYKKARLFEEEEGNMAYKYADEHIRKVIGDKIYESEQKDAENKEDLEADEDEDDIFEEHECEMSAEKLFEKWKLTKYIESFIDEEGYDEPNLWKDISIEELKNDYGFKAGHAKKFVHHVQEFEKGRDKFEEIKKKRKIKNKQKKKAEVKEEVMVLQEVEVPQKGKTQMLKQQSGSGSGSGSGYHVLAQPQKLQKEGDGVAPGVEGDIMVKRKSRSQSPGQSYITPPQSQSQTSVLSSHSQTQAQAQAQPQYAQNELQQQPQYAIGNVLPPGWSMMVTNDGKPYYLNTVTKVTQWDKPTSVDMPPLQQQQQQNVNVVPQYVQQQYVVPQQQNINPMQSPLQQYNLQQNQIVPPLQQNQMQPQLQQYNMKAQHSQNQIQQQQSQMLNQPQYGLKPQNSQNMLPQQYNPQQQQQQQQYRLNPQNSANPLPQNQIQAPLQQNQQLQPQKNQLQPQQNQLQYNQQLQRQNSPPQQTQQFGLSPRKPNPLQQGSPYINAQPQQPPQQPPQTHIQQYGSGQYQQTNEQLQEQQPQPQPIPQPHQTHIQQYASGQYQQTNEQLQQALQQQQEQQKLLLLQQQQQQQKLLQQQQQQMTMGTMSGLGGGGMNMGAMMGGMMGGMMNNVNAMQNNMNNSMTNMNNNSMSSVGIEADVGNDTDTFHENLAKEIAQEDDKNFNSAYNSLYGANQQQQKQKQQQQKPQQQTSSPFGMGSMVGGFGNM